MFKISLANKWFFSEDLRKSCNGCGADNPVLARFCGKCGLRLRAYKEKPIDPGKTLAFFSIFFIMAFSTTFLFLSYRYDGFQKTRVFTDVPLDHQVYQDCKNLLNFDGIKQLKRGELSAYEMISMEDFNQAIIAAVRFNKCELKQEFLLTDTDVSSKIIFEKLELLAQAASRIEFVREIEQSALNDLSRFNVFRLIEKVFMQSQYE